MFDASTLSSIQIGLASPEKIHEWSRGEVKLPETINYRSQKPERDGLFCEVIFGPFKDYECACGKYKKIRFAGTVCEKCGVEVTTKSVRRERMGHIELVIPVAHIWYFKLAPSRIGQVLNISPKSLDEVISFISNVVLDAGDCKLLTKREVLDEKVARMRFISIMQEIKERIEANGPIDPNDEEIAATYIEKMENQKDVFDFYTYSNFITKYTGAKFGMGAEAIQTLLKEVDIEEEFNQIQKELKETQGPKNQKRKSLIKRLDVVGSFRNSNNKPEWMILTAIPVIPPELRPMLPLEGGRYACSDLNELYRRVVYRNNRLKKFMNANTPDVMLINEKRLLQEAVDALIDNGRRNKPVTGTSNRPLKSLSHALKGKRGRFRQNLLGKRVDFSGRSVIAVGPDLKMSECGVPREMAIQLFKPFIAAEILKKGYVLGHKQAENLIETQDARIWPILDEIIKERPVLLNRAPTLHRLGIQAFMPKLVDGRAIRLHPLVCPAFNADFDGDQMAIHVPLSDKAMKEAKYLMLGSKNILGPKDGKPIVTPSQDMVLGNYYLTMEETIEEFTKQADEARDLGNFEKEARYRIYAMSEGKVFATIYDVMNAYDTRQIHIHNRIAIKTTAFDVVDKMTFTEEQRGKLFITTPGKIIFNSIFPKDMPFLQEVSDANFKQTPDKYFVEYGTNIREYLANTKVNKPFNSKSLGVIINEVFTKTNKANNAQATSEMLDRLKDQGFKYATLSGITVSLADIPDVKGKEEKFQKADKEIEVLTDFYNKGLLTDAERHEKVVALWKKVGDSVEKDMIAAFESNIHNPMYMMSDSGARGKKSNFQQLSGMRGLMSKPGGDVIEIPIKSSFREGLTVAEYFIATHGTRKGGADTALKTAGSGYLTRRLVDVAQDVIVREDDCGTDHGTIVRNLYDDVKTKDGKLVIIESLRERLIGRYTLHDILDPKTNEILVPADTLMDEKMAQLVSDRGVEEVEIRTLFGCQTKGGVCKKCYGRNIANGLEVAIGEAVGVMAAQSIGEPGTQLTMRTFHTGGVAGGSDITQGLPRIEELLEARNPKGEAVISDISGEIASISIGKDNREEIVVKNDLEERAYLGNLNGRACVKVGDIVKNGDKLTSGTINPKKLLEVSDVTAVQNYILKEVQKVYRATEIQISDKHIEVVVRQLFKKMVVIEAGDTELLAGTKVSIKAFTDANKDAILANKRPAVGRPLVLGLTKASLETDSFLSAASFQETPKILADAAIKGKIDTLHGLKENVIIGKPIPAGTGLSKTFIPDFEDEEEEFEIFDENEDFEVEDSEEVRE